MTAYIKNMKTGEVWTGDEWANPNEQGVLSAADFAEADKAQQELDLYEGGKFDGAKVVESAF